MGISTTLKLELVEQEPELLEVRSSDQIEEEKLSELCQNIEFLKRELNSKIFSELKQCNVSIKSVIGEVNDVIKKRK